MDGLQQGEVIQLERWGRWAVVGPLLGSGGEGFVHEVALDHAGGHRLALKWYRPGLDTATQREALAQLVEVGPPDDRFLWPLDLTRSANRAGFGYVMALRRDGLSRVHDLLSLRVSASWRTLARVGMGLADAFLVLHARGLCYRDINLGNVFFDPVTGDVAVCDCDNVGVSGVAPPRVLGAVGFMAPEVARGERMPDTATDRHSLAVLLFQLLVRHDPFLGRAEEQFPILDSGACRYLWGEHPVFVFDPDDRSNAPTAAHQNATTLWPMLPAFVRRLFTRAFTDGLRDPDNGRVTESEWRAAMARLADLAHPCPACGAEHLFDPADPVHEPACWRCQRPVPPPLRARLRRAGSIDVVTLPAGAALYPHHLTQRRYDFSVPLAVVTTHPEHPDRLGLTNHGTEPFTLMIDGNAHDVPPGRTARIQPGTDLRFGPVECRVEA